MLRQLRKVLTVAGAILLLAASPAFAAGNGNGHHPNDNWKHRYIPVQILGINDFHGKLNKYQEINGKTVGGAAYLAAYLKEYESRNKNTLLVHAGDAVGASPPISALLQDEPTIEILNELGFDVGTVGNHEFDEGVQEMLRLINGVYNEKTGYFEGASFPYTVANVVDSDTGDPILPPYVIKKVNGMPIGFIGVVTTQTPKIVTPGGTAGVTFLDEAASINKAAAELEDQGVEAIVVLAHVSASSDMDGTNPGGQATEIAKKIDDEVDVIFAGHNNHYTNTVVDGKLIMETYSYGTSIADVDLKIDPRTKDVAAMEGQIILTAHEGIQPDPEIKQMVENYKEQSAELVNRVVGHAAENLSIAASGIGESELGDLIADSHRAAMGSDFAFMNEGGIRQDVLKQGEITWGELYTIQPFGNQLIQKTFTGAQIKAILEQQSKAISMLQVSGLHYTWDPSKPVGERVVSLTFPDGTKIDPNEEYTVAANGFLAAGGDGYSVFAEGTNVVQGPIDLEATVDYIEAMSEPISQDIEGRITVK
ncbi:MAG TPA: 5'-nucleotidase C-terminal domain-containing protein [Bacillales bacterium]|nr:5'-nucleotidase C-terminal domain-containing protein [Bacillales bacterium]